MFVLVHVDLCTECSPVVLFLHAPVRVVSAQCICVGLCSHVPFSHTFMASSSLPHPEGVYLPPPHELVDIPQNKGTRMYVDPRTYQSTTQAVSTVATEIPPKYIKLVEEIGGGELVCVMCVRGWSVRVECEGVECEGVKCEGVECEGVECEGVECEGVECEGVECEGVECEGVECKGV